MMPGARDSEGGGCPTHRALCDVWVPSPSNCFVKMKSELNPGTDGTYPILTPKLEIKNRVACNPSTTAGRCTFRAPAFGAATVPPVGARSVDASRQRFFWGNPFREKRVSGSMASNLLMNKYFTYKSLFLKDLAPTPPKSLIPKDSVPGVLQYQPVNKDR